MCTESWTIRWEGLAPQLRHCTLFLRREGETHGSSSICGLPKGSRKTAKKTIQQQQSESEQNSPVLLGNLKKKSQFLNLGLINTSQTRSPSWATITLYRPCSELGFPPCGHKKPPSESEPGNGCGGPRGPLRPGPLSGPKERACWRIGVTNSSNICKAADFSRHMKSTFWGNLCAINLINIHEI